MRSALMGSLLQINGMSTAQLKDELLLAGQGSFGKQALAAGALAESCFRGTEIGALLFEALNRPGAMLAYDMETSGLMVLDPDEKDCSTLLATSGRPDGAPKTPRRGVAHSYRSTTSNDQLFPNPRSENDVPAANRPAGQIKLQQSQDTQIYLLGNLMTDHDWKMALISRTIGALRGRAARGSPRD